MFGMGVTLKFADFKQILVKKKLVFTGIILQYTVMPISAFLISRILSLPEEIFIGMIIVGACPGGTASNVMTYLSKANVALSVTLTLASTLAAPLITPVIIYLFLSQTVSISFVPMVVSVFWIVLFPLIDGLVIRHFFQKKFDNILQIFPSISIISISMVIACVVALNQNTIMSFPLIIFFAVVLHNASGMAAGYFAGKTMKVDEKDCRTLAFEVGMQNSGLGVTLATQFFSSASALPGAIFSLWHNISGIVAAKFWSRK